jgi:hypothetical protein
MQVRLDGSTPIVSEKANGPVEMPGRRSRSRQLGEHVSRRAAAPWRVSDVLLPYVGD